MLALRHRQRRGDPDNRRRSVGRLEAETDRAPRSPRACSAVSFVIKAGSSPCSVFRPYRVGLLCLLLTSDRSATPLAGCRALPGGLSDLPQVRCSHLHAYTRCIYFRVLRTGIGLQVFRPPHPTRLPHMQFLFVRPALCFRLPSDPASRRTPLPSANRSPCRAGRGLATVRGCFTSK